MNAEQVATFVAVLGLLVGAATLGVLVLLVLRRRVPAADRAVAALAEVALWSGAAVAAGATAGSLYFSEVAGYVPCELCWFQRICMYPLAATLTIAAWRRDVPAWRYAIVPAGVGAAIAVYHTQLQAFPEQSTFCSTTVPCNVRTIWEFGFVSLPFLALVGFCFVLTMLRVAVVGTGAGGDPE